MELVNLENYFKHVPITEIAEIKRARKDETVPKGTIYIQVSACRKTDFEIWKVTERNEPLETKYAYLIPKINWNPFYMKEVLNKEAPAFMTKYVGKNINISMDLFKFYTIDYHYEIETQNQIAEILESLRAEIFKTNKKIENNKALKKWCLNTMFAMLNEK